MARRAAILNGDRLCSLVFGRGARRGGSEKSRPAAQGKAEKNDCDFYFDVHRVGSAYPAAGSEVSPSRRR